MTTAQSEMPIEEFTDWDGIRLRVDAENYSALMQTTLRESRYEGRERTLVPRMLAPGDRVLEIGSAIGFIAMVAARVVGAANVLCVEANPRMVVDAERNFVANGIEISQKCRVLVNELAWPGPGQTIDFHVARDFWASSLERSDQTIETVSVPLLCLEKEAREHRATTIICDIEGGEVALFDGADLTGIRKLVMELHPNRTPVGAINRMVRQFVRQGFSIDLPNTWGGMLCCYRGLDPRC